MGLVVNLLFRVLLDAGADGAAAALACLAFGTVLYLAEAFATASGRRRTVRSVLALPSS